MSARRRALTLGIALLLSAHAATARADTKMDAATAAAEDAGTPLAPASVVARPGSPVLPTAPNEVVLADGETRQQYLAAMRRYYEYRAAGYAYRSRVFEWQLLSSRMIFGVVLVLVGAGIYFAAAQFRLATRTAREGDAPKEGGGPAAGLATQLEISSKGVVVSSSVLGVIILSLSLAFFYLYLVYVYPVVDTF